MSDVDPQARKEVNDALVNAGGAAVGQLVKTAHSSIEKRRKNEEEREAREAADRAAREKADAAVRAPPGKRKHSEPVMPVLTANDDRRAAPPARHGRPGSLLRPIARERPFGDLVLLDPLTSTEFHVCWHFREAALSISSVSTWVWGVAT